ncbi:MAG: restriction endonuclease [Helicobacteraceae bacterium]|jgi:hypothetical protein|nr:restriction endonuclease [Helicobacteraceae bacterium]
MTKEQLFLELAKPNEDGISRWVSVNEFKDKYSELKLGNGGAWRRRSSSLARKYIVEFNKEITKGVSIDAIKLNGYNINPSFNQNIRDDIKECYKMQNCVMLGINGKSENTKIEIDHKDGRKNNLRVSDLNKQTKEDFQPLCKAANDVKRQLCKRCKEGNKRWDAKNIKGNPYSFYKGDENYNDELGCIGCYQYDPVAYRKTSVQKISREVCNDIMKKLYPDET